MHLIMRHEPRRSQLKSTRSLQCLQKICAIQSEDFQGVPETNERRTASPAHNMLIIGRRRDSTTLSHAISDMARRNIAFGCP